MLALLLLLAASPAATPAGAFESAIADYRKGDCEAAMPALRTLAAAGSRAGEAAVALRDCYEKKYGTDGAIAALEKEIAATPGDAVAHANLGCFYLAKG